MQNHNNLAGRLKQALTRQNMSQRALAEKTGVSPQAVNKWLQSGNIGRQHMIECAAILGVTTEWLLTGTMPGVAEPAGEYNVTNGAVTRAVPLLQQSDIGRWLDGALESSVPQRQIACQCACGLRSFAISMSEGGDLLNWRLSTGDYVFVDPDADHATAGKSAVVVLAKAAASDQYELLSRDELAADSVVAGVVIAVFTTLSAD